MRNQPLSLDVFKLNSINEPYVISKRIQLTFRRGPNALEPN